MPLEAQVPQLDSRRFEQIYNDARQRIPLYAPEWTDYNDSDPGIALLQLFAYLTENLYYEMNRIPERNYIKFLQLLNMQLRPAIPAVAHLTFTTNPNVETNVSIQPRTPVAAQPPEGGNLVIFETLSGLDLVRAPLSHVQVYDGNSFQDVTAANEAGNTSFFPFGFQPDPSSALYLGFKAPENHANVFPAKISLRVFLPVAEQAGKAQKAADATIPPTPPVKLEWEYLPENTQRWRKLTVYKDESAAFIREGYIEIQGPSDLQATSLQKVSEECYWLRCRLVGESYPAGRVPKIAFIRANVVAAENLSTVRDEVVGTSDGEPDQSFTLERRPVSRKTLELVLESSTQAESVWEQVDDFLHSKFDSPHYVLDATSGTIRFGDGKNGLIPVAGTTITARSYRYGGGQNSNVASKAVNMLLGSVDGVESVTNERRAEGGQDEQSIDELKRSAPEMIRSRNRAVTPEDYEVLAKQVGGVLQAKALALANPNHPGVEVPGAVTVVIVPDNDDLAPKPSSDIIRQVCKYLNDFRLLTTEVYVKGPDYKAIRVEATLEVQPYAAFDEVKRQVIAAINEYLNPRTWEFGGELYPTNLYAVILKVKDVKVVKSLTLRVDGQPHDGGLTDPVKLKMRDMLIYGEASHDITPVPYNDI